VSGEHLQPTYISVDIEAAGPYAGRYSLLSIGACLARNPDLNFYVELKPTNKASDPGAMRISGLSLANLEQRGAPPAEAMRRFQTWLSMVSGEEDGPVFVAFNAPFDWMFINEYFHRYIGHNPFGHRALDMKALFMGLFGVDWAQTGMRNVAKRLNMHFELEHHALEDAKMQASLFMAMLEIWGKRRQARIGEEKEET
jgi:DNA polymerase III epsilon subunit-like protein